MNECDVMNVNNIVFVRISQFFNYYGWLCFDIFFFNVKRHDITYIFISFSTNTRGIVFPFEINLKKKF